VSVAAISSDDKSVVWIGSRSTFVLSTALLTGRLSVSLSDVLELPQLLDHGLLKSTCYQFVNSELYYFVLSEMWLSKPVS